MSSKVFQEKILLFPIVSLFLVFPLFANPLFSPVFTVPKVWFLWVSGSLVFLALSFYSVNKSEIKPAVPVLLYLMIAIVSFGMSDSKATSLFGEYARWDGLITIFLSMILFAAPIVGLNKKHVVICIKSLLGSSILISLIAIYERFFQNPFIILTKTYDPAGHGALNTMDMSRSVATFGSPLYLAAFLILVMPVSIYFISKNKPADRLLGVATLLLATCALLLTYSRGAWLGIIVALIWMILANRKELSLIKKPLLAVLVVAMTFGVLFSYLKPGETSLSQRFASIVRAEAGARPGIWDSTLKMIESRPLFGYGPDGFKNSFIRFKQKSWNTNGRQPIPDKAHNEIFQQAATVGILGLTAFLWIVSYIFLKFRSYDGENKLLIASIGASLAAYLVQSLFNFFQISTSPIFWLLAGMGVATALGGTGSPVPLQNSKRTYIDLGLRALVCAPIMIFANFLWLADFNFQQSLAFGADNNKRIAHLNNATFLFRYEERYFANIGKALTQLYKEQKTPYTLMTAERALDKALALNGDSVETLLIKADLYSAAWLANFDPKKDNLPQLKIWAEKALRTYDAVLAIDPRQTDAHLGRGTIQAYNNNFEEAIFSWQEALAIDPGSANAYFNIGWGYEKLNKFDKALDAYQKAVELAPGMTEAQEAKLRLTTVNN